MSHITAVAWYIMRVDGIQLQMEKGSRKKWSHVICEIMVVEEGLSSEKQNYYAHSMNTMCVVESDRLFSENDKFWFSVQVC